MSRSTQMVCKILILIGLAALPAQARQLHRDQDVQPTDIFERWHKAVLTTMFWVGEGSVGAGWSACKDSAWDVRWLENFGGTDTPTRRSGYHPATFTPKQNPFYIALPFNDLKTAAQENSTVSRFLSFWREIGNRPRTTKSVCKNQWIAVTYRGRTCYAQWQDVGPVTHDDYDYVFGFQQPKSHAQNMAGLDVSPAVRDFLDFPGFGRTDWRFVQESEVPAGPWSAIITRD